jgi:hypothetical protein
MRTPGFAASPAAALLLTLWAAHCPSAGQTTQPATTQPKECERLSLTAARLEELIKQSKQPAPWLKWGADFRFRHTWAPNLMTLNKNAPNHTWHMQRYRGRLWATVTPHEDVDLNFRITYEPRVYWKPDNQPSFANNEALIDNLNVVWRKPLGLPVTATVGRQDVVLGRGWLVLDGTPFDDSRTIFLDAVRLTWDLKDLHTTVDTIYVDQKGGADNHLPTFGREESWLVEQDEHGLILYATNRSLPRTQVEGYYILKMDRANHPHRGYWPPWWSNDADIHTFGAAVEHDFLPTDHPRKLLGRAEFAQQLGNKNRHNLCALGFNGRLDYFLKDRFQNSFRIGYEYASGDDPDSGTNEAFDRVWGRWARLSEIFAYVYAGETRIAEFTNFHRLGLGWSCKPHRALEFCLDYHLLWADQNTNWAQPGFSDKGPFRGQLATALLKYRISEHLSGHLSAEAFFPGNYYSASMNDPALFLRYELVLAW